MAPFWKQKVNQTSIRAILFFYDYYISERAFLQTAEYLCMHLPLCHRQESWLCLRLVSLDLAIASVQVIYSRILQRNGIY